MTPEPLNRRQIKTLATLVTLSTLADDSGRVDMAIGELAAALSIHPRTLHRRLEQLRRRGVASHTRSRGNIELMISPYGRSIIEGHTNPPELSDLPAGPRPQPSRRSRSSYTDYNAYKFLMLLTDLADDDSQVAIQQAQLSEITGAGPNTLRRWGHILQDQGAINITRKPHCLIYSIAPAWIPPTDPQDLIPPEAFCARHHLATLSARYIGPANARVIECPSDASKEPCSWIYLLGHGPIVPAGAFPKNVNEVSKLLQNPPPPESHPPTTDDSPHLSEQIQATLDLYDASDHHQAWQRILVHLADRMPQQYIQSYFLPAQPLGWIQEELIVRASHPTAARVALNPMYAEPLQQSAAAAAGAKTSVRVIAPEDPDPTDLSG